MLIFNIDVADLLCNGATGTVCGIEEDQNENILAVIVEFDDPRAGAEARRRNPMMSKKYPNGTVIKKKEHDYALGRDNGMLSSTAKLIQFPLVLAWGVTVNKFQGSTVKSPQIILADLKTVFDQAQKYLGKEMLYMHACTVQHEKIGTSSLQNSHWILGASS